jgi:hypothetical protein
LRGCPSLVGGRPANNVDWSEFKFWVYNKYANSWAITICSYARKYLHLLTNIRDIDNLQPTIRTNVIKSLIVLSKFLGISTDFKNELKNYGIKLGRPNNFTTFMRILNASNNNDDLVQWFRNAFSKLRNDEQKYLVFLLYTGLRKEEAIKSFNKIIQLCRGNKLSEYYNEELSCLQHFKYPNEFIRNTKNVFISFVTKDLLNEIINCKPVTYDAMSRRLYRNNIKVRFNELRDYYGTYLLQHGILEQEINLLQGRIPPSIFIKHYWSPKLSELRDRVMMALKKLEQSMSN